MADLELTFDSATAVSHFDVDGIVPTSATCSLTKANGSVVESSVVTLPSLSTTVQTGSTASVLILGSVTGLARGDHFRVTSAGQDYVVQAMAINATTKVIDLTVALPVTPVAADVVRSLKMTATLAAVGLAGIGGSYRLVWSYTDSTNTRQVGYPATVVRWPWVSPCSASAVAEMLDVN